MHDFTQAAIDAMAAEMPQTVKANIYLADKTVIEITEADLMNGGYSYSGQVLAGQKFGPGGVCASSVTLVLLNIDHRYDGIDFQGAEFVPYEGQRLNDWDEPTLDNLVEWRQGTRYTILDPTDSNGEIVTLIGYDNLIHTATDYVDALSYPVTLGELAAYCCNQCGIALANPDFHFSNFVIERRPTFADGSYQQMLSYIAQIACCFVVANKNGEAEFKWLGEDPVHEIKTAFGSSAHFNNVTITGCRVKAIGTEDDYGETWLIGEDGYVIEIGDNPLVVEGSARTIAENLASRLNGLEFRPITLQTMPDLQYELGDCFEVSTDLVKNGPSIGFITNLSYTINDVMSIKCTAETAARSNLKTYSQNTATDIRNQIKLDKAAGGVTGFESNVIKMNKLAANTLGFHYSQEKQNDGSIIAYWHDKPNREESTVIYMQGADGFFLSKDGGETWTNGFDAEGNAVVNILSAIGINAQWLNIDDVVERINQDGTVTVDGAKVSVDGQGLTSKFESITETAESQASLIQQLADSIVGLVRDGNGGSMLQQDANGLWYFNLGPLQQSLSDTANSLDDLSGIVLDANGQIDVLKSTAAALQQRTEYVRSYTDENGQPCLELGEGDSTFRVKITNTQIQFMEGTTTPAYLSNQKLYIEKAEVINELQMGGFVWKVHGKGNMGLIWKGAE